MAAPLRKNLGSLSGSTSSLTGHKFGATLDLLRLLSSNLFKLDAMLKVHDEADIELKNSLIEALDSVRKVCVIFCTLCVSLASLRKALTSSDAFLKRFILTDLLNVDCIAN